MKMNPVIFREYDIRGVFDVEFDLVFAELLGRALVSFIAKQSHKQNPTISIGHDARTSSPQIVEALSSGIRSSGGNVVLLGLVTTPVCYYSTFHIKDLDGAFMVTGSHNPPEYNGFKISVGKSTIFGADIQALKTIIDNKDFLQGKGNESHYDIFTPYVSRYKEEFGDLKRMPVTLDCGNGAAGSIVRRLYEAVGLAPDILFEEPDGNFPNHHPDPTVDENLVDLKKAVIENKSLVGIGFDGDADRIGVVDHTGRTILGDDLMALCSQDILKSLPGSKIIGDVKCSDRLFDYVAKHGGEPITWKTGHSLIKNKIKVEKAPFGGELSGHIFFADRNYGYDDALYAGLRVIEILHNTGKTIDELLSDLPKAYNTPEIRIDTTEEKKHLAVNALKEKYSTPSEEHSTNLIDGVRVSFQNGWALARVSNTQPVLVLRFEADSEDNLAKIQKSVEDVVLPALD